MDRSIDLTEREVFSTKSEDVDVLHRSNLRERLSMFKNSIRSQVFLRDSKKPIDLICKSDLDKSITDDLFVTDNNRMSLMYKRSIEDNCDRCGSVVLSLKRTLCDRCYNDLDIDSKNIAERFFIV